MAIVVLSATAVANLDELIETRRLPATTRDRLRASLEALSAFPQIGPLLAGRWSGFRFIQGPWRWMLIVYDYQEATDRVLIATIQDSRSARSATTDR